ncbi:MAG: hypothetical protein ACXWRE_16780 [Pseudobdellovibrionaceae bacterium]
MKTNKLLFSLSALALLFNFGCAKSSQFEGPVSNEASHAEDSLNPPPALSSKTYPLLWEAARAEGKDWTRFVFDLIHHQTPNLIQGSEDMATFCPRYSYLTTDERVNLWGLLISAMAKYESGFNPTSRMQETTMGIDPITQKPVYSEGLLQLSYQDSKAYPFCDEFNWNLDKHLSSQDPRKTILDPYKNLNCGVKILAQQLKNKNRIILSKGVYWSVLKLGGKYNKIKQIAALTKKMPGCMK